MNKFKLMAAGACWLVMLVLLTAGCAGSDTGGDGGMPLDEVLAPGQVRAGVITRQSELLSGVDAHGWLGDFKLYNDKVAFIVENIDEPRGWAPFGGTLIDADRIRAEGESGEELFEELMPNIDWMTLYPQSATVVSDGSDGTAAVVSVSGVHHGIPLVDAALNGALEPKNLDIVQEYILEPGAEYLRIRTSITSRSLTSQEIAVGDLVLNGDRTVDFFPGVGPSQDFPAESAEYYAGFAPGLCYLYTGAEGGLHSALSLHDITPMVVAQGRVKRGAEPLVVERLLLVGAGGMDSCLKILRQLRGGPETGELGGVIRDDQGQPQPGLSVLVHDDSLPENLDIVDQTFSDEQGRYRVDLPAGNYRVEVRAPGREPVLVAAPELAAGQSVSADVTIPAAAVIEFSCRGRLPGGESGDYLPCKLSLQPGPNAALSAPVATDYITFAASGQGRAVVPAGQWTATLSRGWEYTIHRQDVDIASGQTMTVAGLLERQVDTTGFIAADLHNHSTRSIDSTFEIKDKIASNACEGVELVILTDHDCQSDFTPQLEEMIAALNFDLHQWLRLVTGNEVSPHYAHHTAFPLPAHPTGWGYWDIPWTLYKDGLFVRYLEYPEILPRDRELGAEIINVAHPLSGSGYFNYLGFDPPGVMPRLDSLDPAKFSPDFDTIELLNSKDVDVMLNKILPMWAEFNNQGFFRTASGVSDAHQRGAEAGFGRTMVKSSSDEPARIDLDEIWRNLRQHRALVSGGLYVEITVAGGSVGDLVQASGQVAVHVRVQAADWVPAATGRVWLLANGLEVATAGLAEAGAVDPGHPALRFDDDFTITVDRDTWVAAVAEGPAGSTLNPVFRGAHPVGMTNAVQIDADGNGSFDAPEQ